MKKKILITTAVILSLALVIGGAFIWLTLGSYKAGEAAESALVSDDRVKVTEEDGLLVFEPSAKYEYGIIFYPGGMVDHRAYAPLMRELAMCGILSVIVEMPLDFAFLNVNGALDVLDRFPEVSSWTLGGHSLGGAMAASHAAKNPEKYDTLLLLAAYSTEDISESGIKVLSVYGEYDEVLNFEKYIENKDNLPIDTVELVIYGGNHAMFGDYGVQKGDGKATIEPSEQLAAVVNLLVGY